jgi:hypothetical protein
VDALRECALSGALAAPPPRRAAAAAPLFSLALLRGDLSPLLAGATSAPAFRGAAAVGAAPDVTPRLRALSAGAGRSTGAGRAALPPCLLAACPALEDVTLPRAGLSEVPFALLAPGGGALRALRLPGNGLTLSALESALPFLPPALALLDLRGNALEGLPRPGLLPRRLCTLLLGGNGGVGQGAGAGGGGEAATRAAPPWDDALFGLHHLATLDLSHCGLPRLPFSVLTLRALAALDVSNNGICEVPPLLGCLPRLRDVNIGGNPQRQVRHATVERGAPAVLEFLRGRVPPGGEGAAEAEYAARPPRPPPARPLAPQGLPEWWDWEAEGAAELGAAAPPARPPPPPSAAECLRGAPPPQLQLQQKQQQRAHAHTADPVDPTSQLPLGEIRRRIFAVAGALQEAEDANVGRGSHKLAAARRDLAMLRAAEARAVGLGGGGGSHGV